ncbi:MAG: EAL domain-containing protein [Rhodospirillales bacterium]|nr:EAL domain-containing protein [Rhodospirillales bacterium]MCB9996154.1 EAL domain-containing protein [Rhodospirillales bacterium]
MIKRYVFPKDTVLFGKGETRQCAYLIDKGEVSIIGNDEGGEDKLLCIIGEGELFGEMALVDNTPRTATAVTNSECEIFVIPRDSLYERVKGLDPIVSLLISILIERYRITRIHLPESVKQDKAGDFINKLSKHERMPEDVLRLRNTEEQRDLALKEMKMEQELRAALEQRQFFPHLQPILNLAERRITGFEALIRWQHPEKGLVFPDHFIPVAERTGVVQHLDRLMLEKACELLPVLQEKAGDQKLFISVNLSGINFETYDVVNSVRRTIMDSGVDPSQIKLEITESALIADPDQAEKVLLGLKALGLHIALDDFGTGYSSLGYLHKFSIDDLKIDRSFVMQLHDGSRSIDIVRAIVALAKNFKLNVVAEGIEKEEDIAALIGLDCDMGQGYFFSKPVPVDGALDFIESNLKKG